MRVGGDKCRRREGEGGCSWQLARPGPTEGQGRGELARKRDTGRHSRAGEWMRNSERKAGTAQTNQDVWEREAATRQGILLRPLAAVTGLRIVVVAPREPCARRGRPAEALLGLPVA